MGIFKRKIRGQRAKLYSAKFVFRGKLHQRGGFPDRETAQHWVDSTRMSLRRGEVGYVKARTAAKIIPLIEEFADHLLTLKRSKKYAENTESRLTRMAEEIPWVTLSDFTAANFEAWRAGKPRFRNKVIKPRTLNQFLDHAVMFGDWLVKPRQLIPANPMRAVSETTEASNEGYRRAATEDELNKLLAAAPPERRMFYLFTIYVPLRRRALEGIEWRDLYLDGERPTFTLRPELSKTGKAAKMSIRADLVAALKDYRGDATDADLVFPVVPLIRVMKRDLAAAGVSFADPRGLRRLDLHAFRKTAVRLLKRGGVSLDSVHVFLQHRDRRTTERYYDDDLVAPEISDAAAKMPAFGVGAQSGAVIQSGNEKGGK